MFPVPGNAWIAYGFRSGMSRFDVHRQLFEKETLIVSEEDRQTLAGPTDNQFRYSLVYCSTPQRLYLMKYRLNESQATFLEARKKYEKRYGTPESSGSDLSELENWNTTHLSLIWVINDYETILLTHDDQGTVAEFQDVSVCR